MTKLYTLFDSATSLDALLTQLNRNDDISDVKVYGHAEEGNANLSDPVAVTPNVGLSQTGVGIVFAGTSLEAEGLSDEIAAYFGRNMENGARVVVLDTSDVAATKSVLEAAGGTVSEGG